MNISRKLVTVYLDSYTTVKLDLGIAELCSMEMLGTLHILTLPLRPEGHWAEGLTAYTNTTANMLQV